MGRRRRCLAQRHVPPQAAVYGLSQRPLRGLLADGARQRRTYCGGASRAFRRNDSRLASRSELRRMADESARRRRGDAGGVAPHDRVLCRTRIYEADIQAFSAHIPQISCRGRPLRSFPRRRSAQKHADFICHRQFGNPWLRHVGTAVGAQGYESRCSSG